MKSSADSTLWQYDSKYYKCKSITYSRVIMKQLIWGVLLVLLVSAAAAAAFSSEQRAAIRSCKVDCRLDYRQDSGLCREQYQQCRTLCKTQYAECKTAQELDYDTCQGQCQASYDPSDPSLDKAVASEVRRELRQCMRTCSSDFRKNKREFCSLSDCRRACYDEKRSCTNTSRDSYKSCKTGCLQANVDITCENGRYQAGTVLLRGCDRCECRFNGRLHCEKSPTCNYDVEINEEECSEGYYQRLCKGPYFRLRCSRQKYCQCEGDAQYECPSDYICIHEFSVKIPDTIEGFRDSRGIPLGDIGICAREPDLPNCGNGACENIVCDDCPGPESSVTCPEDCSD